MRGVEFHAYQRDTPRRAPFRGPGSSACAAPQKAATRSETRRTPTERSPCSMSASNPPATCTGAAVAAMTGGTPRESPGSKVAVAPEDVEWGSEESVRVRAQLVARTRGGRTRLEYASTVARRDRDLAPADPARERRRPRTRALRHFPTLDRPRRAGASSSRRPPAATWRDARRRRARLADCRA